MGAGRGSQGSRVECRRGRHSRKKKVKEKNSESWNSITKAKLRLVGIVVCS